MVERSGSHRRRHGGRVACGAGAAAAAGGQDGPDRAACRRRWPAPRLLQHDRGRVLADLACAIADGARVISDFRVMGDQAGGVRAGRVGADGVADAEGDRAGGGTADRRKLTAAVNTARRYAWAQVVARHGGAARRSGSRTRSWTGVTCIRLDATVTPAHSDKELAEANFKGFGHHPLLAYCDNTGGEPLAWMLRHGSAGQQHGRRSPARCWTRRSRRCRRRSGGS